ncbi:hypothetical protein [Actinoplanes sichuanensis]|uniref:Uncharacterized protein n=1 Tax=Actinoplanes sichuanensis TaxID=512349 RepID=A0ABW4AN48_9ACTN|nr:hypothetical protein [Actinoplanes sichuanensis]
MALAVGGVAMVWPAPTAPPPAAVAPVADERMVAGPLDGRTAAWLTVGDAAARVRVRFARLPGLLYRISTASDAGVVPVVSRRDGRVTLRLNEADGDGLDEVRIVLNRNVRWDIRLPAGAGEQQLNLRDGRVRRVEVGAAGLAEVWLPEPDGTVPVVFTGGIGTAVVSVRYGTPVRIHLTQGAGSVETPWLANNGTAAGTVLRESDFRQALDRYAIRADGGIGALVLRRPADRDPQDVPGPVVQQPGPANGQPEPPAEQPRRAGQPKGTGQLKGAEQPKGTGQLKGAEKPKGTGQPKRAGQPKGTGQSKNAEQPKRVTGQPKSSGKRPASSTRRPGSASTPDLSDRRTRRAKANTNGSVAVPGSPRHGTQPSRAPVTDDPTRSATAGTGRPPRNGATPTKEARDRTGEAVGAGRVER